MESSQNVASIDEETKELGSIAEENYDDEYIQTLLDREAQTEEILHPDWVLRARLDGVQYILKTRERLGFRVQTAYASVAYLDRYLSRRSVGEEQCWAVRLLSMACLSLAAKMEEVRVCTLSEFCWEEYSFENSVIQRMELLVLNTLEWKMGLVSPFGFIHFFANKFLDTSPSNEVFKAVEVILGSMRDMKLMCNRPSVVAAAATLIVVDQGLTRAVLHLKISPLTASFTLQIEEIIDCYYQIQEMESERSLRLSEGVKSPDLSPTQLHSSSVTCSGGSRKRKRLVFNENDDENDGVPDKKRKP